MNQQKNDEQLRPILDYINTLALLKETAKSEAKSYLFQVIAGNSEKIATLFVNDFKNQDKKKLHKQLQKNVVIPILDLAQKYKVGAMQAASVYAKAIISEVRKSRLKKSFWDWLSSVKNKEKEIETEAREMLANRLENAALGYELATKSLMSDLFLAGSNRAAKERITEEIAGGKRETGTFFNASAESAGSYIWQIADLAANEAFQSENLERMKWITFFSNSCPDCEDLHGKVKTYERWQIHGLPRSGVTVCRSHCHCVLVPVEYPVEIAKPMSLASGREILQRINEETRSKTRDVGNKKQEPSVDLGDDEED